jgi:hypothetical protein
MNALTLLRLDTLRLVSGLRNRLESEDLFARLGATLSIGWAIVLFAAFVTVVRGGSILDTKSPRPLADLNARGASVLLTALFFVDSVRRGRSRTRARFENWLLSAGIRETTLRARGAVVVIARSFALAWLLLVPCRWGSSNSVSVGEGFVWAFGVMCAGESVGRAWQTWPQFFRFVWCSVIFVVWSSGVVILFRLVDDARLCDGVLPALGLTGVYALTVCALTRSVVGHETRPEAHRGARRLGAVSEQGRVLGILRRDLGVVVGFVRSDFLSVLLISLLAGLPQAQFFTARIASTARDTGSAAGVFLTLIQVALIGTVVGEVLWERERPSTWAFYRSAGALRSVVVARAVVTVITGLLWYGVVTAPTSIFIGMPSMEKHSLAVAVLCAVGGVIALGSALGVALGSSPAQCRAFRMVGVAGAVGLFFGLAGSSQVVREIIGIGTLSCLLVLALAFLSRVDLGLQRF